MPAEQLPQWVEYVKALGTPIVALIAALLAGLLAYRQWVTARNKLKLDFFDKRITIYKLAVTALQNIRNSAPTDIKSIEDLEESMHAARWLFDKKAELYLRELSLKIYLDGETKKMRPVNWSELEFAEAITDRAEREQSYQAERQKLDMILAKFLAVEH